MDAVSELLLNGIVRTTLCTTMAALATLLILPILGINSARTHRVAWVLVIFQGWLILPLTFTVSVANQAPAKQPSIVSSIPAESSQVIQSPIQPRVDESSLWQGYGEQAVFVSCPQDLGHEYKVNKWHKAQQRSYRVRHAEINILPC